jgi:hypothetical protein
MDIGSGRVWAAGHVRAQIILIWMPVLVIATKPTRRISHARSQADGDVPSRSLSVSLPSLERPVSAGSCHS